MEAVKSVNPESETANKSPQQRQKGIFSRWLKILIFAIYTYCIYQSYVFSIAIVELVIKWDRLSWHLVEQGLQIFFIVPLCVYFVIMHPDFYIPILILLSIYGVIFWAWWKRQSIYTAFLIALTGQLIGPAWLLFFRMPGDGGFKQPGLEMGMIGVEVFYFSLLIAHIVQKKFFPHNKFANCIRKILAWPCVRT